MLTQKQKKLLEFIDARLKKDGVPPSFDEMKEALDLRSKSGIHRLITALEERGFIRRLAHRARAIEIVKMPETVHTKTPSHSSYVTDEAANSIEIELMGRIAAGTPISAIQHPTERFPIPQTMLSGSGNIYALEVDGDSMIEAGIHNGDIVMINEQNDAQNGDIIVALVDDEEATLKTLRKKGDYIELEAANSAFQTQKYHASQIKIQGKLVGLMRRY